ncbi:DUF2135 domain-containing protein [Leeia sp. TBRC 13508]|uniref:DUF2135 domain-containing protein n=1 Tax=Leeia speluncae TaxID=2884804 RepID=A0ABS8D2S9_9NEIS|nr:DUF2135 domain-containing protein [Leeia speluncae]MCB6182492.1 DUF2135 domain-containing protein [Leeia speluncae]
MNMQVKIGRMAFLWMLLAATSVHALVIETPTNGWNHSGLTDGTNTEKAAYPYSPIYRGIQSERTMIQGRLRSAGKNRQPGKLIVNGNPMVLYSDKEGYYARPYAFGKGSNSIEVRDAQGSKRVQFYEANPNKQNADIRIITAWDDSQAELDMHVITPDGQHAFFANPVLDGGGGLDVDSVDGAGPEMFSVTAAKHGAYHVYINYWGNFGNGGYHFNESTRQKPMITTTITIITYENTLKEKRETFIVPVRKIGELTLVKSMVF